MNVSGREVWQLIDRICKLSGSNDLLNIQNKDGVIVNDIHEILLGFFEYYEELVSEDTALVIKLRAFRAKYCNLDPAVRFTCHFSADDVAKVRLRMTNNKAPNPFDNIKGELLKYGDRGMDVFLSNLFNYVFGNIDIHHEWRKP